MNDGMFDKEVDECKQEGVAEKRQDYQIVSLPPSHMNLKKRWDLKEIAKLWKIIYHVKAIDESATAVDHGELIQELGPVLQCHVEHGGAHSHYQQHQIAHHKPSEEPWGHYNKSTMVSPEL